MKLLSPSLSAQIALCVSLPLAGCALDPAGVQVSDDDQATGSSNAALDEAPAVNFIVLYRFESVPSSAKKDIEAAGGSLVASYPEIGVVIARAGKKDFVTKLSKNLLVDTVAPTAGAGVDALPAQFATTDSAPATRATSGEPLAPMQWNNDLIHVKDAHRVTKGKKSVVVGVIDSGIDDSLPDLEGQVSASKSVTCIGGVADTDAANWRNDVIGHGSFVSGIIAGKDNGVGMVGVAPGVTLAAIKVTEDGLVYPEAFICSVYWAATHGIDLVNASLITDPWLFNCKNDPVQRAIITAQQRAVTFASRKGTTVIAAASNENLDLAHPTVDPYSPTDGEPADRKLNRQCKVLPVGLDGVIGVSATDGKKQLSFYSNYGHGVVDFAAPGGDFHVPMPGNDSGQIVGPLPATSLYYQFAIDWAGRVGVNCSDGLDPNDPNADPLACEETYALLQGTSAAAPHVTGVAALAISRFGKMPTALLQTHLALRSTHQNCPSNPYLPYPDDMSEATCEGSWLYNGFYGNGIIDAYGAVR